MDGTTGDVRARFVNDATSWSKRGVFEIEQFESGGAEWDGTDIKWAERAGVDEAAGYCQGLREMLDGWVVKRLDRVGIFFFFNGFFGMNSLNLPVTRIVNYKSANRPATPLPPLPPPSLSLFGS